MRPLAEKQEIGEWIMSYTKIATIFADGALFSGKVCTTILFVSLIVMVLMPSLSEDIVGLIAVIDGIFMLIAFADYVRTYYKNTPMIQQLEDPDQE